MAKTINGQSMITMEKMTSKFITKHEIQELTLCVGDSEFCQRLLNALKKLKKRAKETNNIHP